MIIFRRQIWVIAIFAMFLGYLVPTNAVAAPGATFSTTPSTSTTLSLDDSATLETTLTLPTNSTLDASMMQTWPDQQALMGTVSAPTGWNLEYKVGSNWVANLPVDRLTVSGVRATATGVQTGPGTANGTQAVATANSTVIVADAASINASGRGDGWNVFLSPLYILNVYHHDSNYKLECHIRTNGNLCDTNSVYQVNGYATGGGPSGTYYRGKVYSAVASGQNMVMICTNVAALPFTSCGTTTVDTGVSYVNGWAYSIGTQTFDGTHIWTGNSNSGKLTCFDVTTATACPAIAMPSFTASAASISSFTSYIGGKVYLAASKLYCIDPATSLSCTGTWPVTVNSGGNQTGVIPKRTSAGVVNGVCTISEDIICFDLTGASATMPAALNTMLTTAASALHGGLGWYQTTAWTNTRQYWSSNTTGTDWSTGNAQCWDWATGAACAGFATNVSYGNSRYAFTIDSGNTNCVWTNGDSGSISNFNGTTGAAGCPVTTTKAAVDFTALPKFSCNQATSVIRTFQSLEIALPNGSTFLPANLRVSVYSGDGNAIAGFQNLSVVNGAVSLAGLQVADTSTDFRFVIESYDAANFPLSTNDANAIAARLIYEADPVQLCVTLTAVMPVCPATLSSGQIAQPDLTTTTTTSYTVTGQTPVVQTQTASFHVNAVQTEQCYIWKTFLNASSQGIDTGGASGGVVDSIVFGPDGKMYVGGTFANSGGVASADFLAAWDGTKWESVGALPILNQGAPVLDGQGNPTFNPALNGRVYSMAFNSAGKLVVTGAFTNAGGNADADYVAIYDPVAKTWSAPANPLNAAVYSVAISSSGIAYLGGAFTGYVTALNTLTTAWVTMPTLNAAVNIVAITSTGTVYVGGAFTGYLKKYDATGNSWVAVSADTNQSTYLTGAVYDMVFANSKLYVVGSFNGVATLSLTPDTWSWLGGSAQPAGFARAISVDEAGNIYVGGNFASAGGVTTENLTMYNGTAWQRFRDARTRSIAMDITQGAGAWKGIWEVTVSPNGVAVWGGDQINCATRSDLDYLCYFGDKIELKKTSVNNTPTTPGPAVTWQSTFTEKIEGGKQLVIKGRLLAGTNKVVIGGKEAKIVSVANDQVVVILPPNPVGEQSLTLSFADQTFKYDSIIRYSTASISESASTARPPVTVTIGGFPDGSPKLTNIIKSRIRAFIKKYGDYKTIECVGYTEGPTVLSTDKALSKSRALNACAYARTGNGLALSVFGIKAGQDTKESSSTRRVVITLRD